ncbi:MAG: hypothetical protein HOJ60_02040 [Euryarchaeota archaeon]|jgi:hypothetical protein|nr:hypothetical protein [Euryarchaeota archaeon]
MIPVVIGVLGAGLYTMKVMSNAATAGTGYALGRKYGRKICEALDQVESTVTKSIDKFRN